MIYRRDSCLWDYDNRTDKSVSRNEMLLGSTKALTQHPSKWGKEMVGHDLILVKWDT